LPTLWVFGFASGLTYRDSEPVVAKKSGRHVAQEEDFDDEDEDDEESEGGRWLALGALTHWFLSIKALFRRLFGRSAGLYSSARSAAARHNDDDLFADAPAARQNGAR
ncbi:hypothetical protein NY536_22225, partial [Enterobacter hormaechei]|nr:hypothetical protein [Enterobacter hormaechei]